MAEIKRITLMNGGEESTASYMVGEKLVSRDGTFTIESLYMQSIGVGDALELPVVRVYAKEKGSPFVDVPFHAISRIFYS